MSFIDDLKKINMRIKHEYSLEISNQMSDTNLMDVYLNTKSVKKNIQKLKDVLSNHVNKYTERRIIMVIYHK